MEKFNSFQKLFVFIYVLALFLFCHHFIIRPTILDWGASGSMQKLSLPGDSIANGDSHTRAVLVHAKPEVIWPWIMQLGQERGGFYSYQLLENLFRADMHNVYALNASLQQPRYVGDTIWLANKNHYNGQGYQIIADIMPMKSFVMVGGEDYTHILRGEKATGSWAIYLYPENENTWLIARSSAGNLAYGDRVLRYFFFEVPHFIMEQKMLRTMKKLAEEQHKHDK